MKSHRKRPPQLPPLAAGQARLWMVDRESADLSPEAAKRCLEMGVAICLKAPQKPWTKSPDERTRLGRRAHTSVAGRHR